MSTNSTINASNSPDSANQAVSEALALAEQKVAAKARKEPLKQPSATEVELLGGFYDPFEGVSTTAEIRELNGIDEEAISKINDIGKALLEVLERGTVKIGNQPATKEILDLMLAGDRELLLLSIRKATFGSEIKLGPGACTECGVQQVFDVDLDKDVPMKKLSGDREFTVSTSLGDVLVTLPNGATQKELVTGASKTSAELDTILLRRSIVSINGMPILNAEQVRLLSIKDRRAIITEITDRNPGPQLSEIKKPCMSCGQEVPLPLTLADLF